MAETFKEKACAHFGVPPERYGETVLRFTLHPHARWLGRFETAAWLALDRNFIADVGRLTRWRGFSELVWEFRREPENRRFRRRALRLRVSVFRMRALFSEVWGGSVAAGRPRPPSAMTAELPSLPLAD